MKEWQPHGTHWSYISGFGLSVVLTLVAYWLVADGVFGGWVLVALIVGLGGLQLLVQLLLFLHLGAEARPRWNLWAFMFMLLVLVILVFGSLWIMSNLDYNMMQMSPGEMDEHMLHEEGIH